MKISRIDLETEIARSAVSDRAQTATTRVCARADLWTARLWFVPTWLQRRFYARPRETLEVANLLDSISVGVDRMQRNSVYAKAGGVVARNGLSNVAAKMIVLQAFMKANSRSRSTWLGVHDLYFEPSMRVSAADSVEPVQCIHVGLQRTRPIPQFKARQS